jgi:uncharacterized lipoprotein YddW (UPF0748 family)
MVSKIGMLLCLLASHALAETRGIWLTTTGTNQIASPENTAATMKKISDIGLNTVYVEVWKLGYTEFPSDVAKKYSGVSMKVNGPLQRDLLQETLIEAHRNRLIHIAWFEYGFMAAYSKYPNELSRRKDWLSLNQNGETVAKNGYIWLNPVHPDAQDLLLGIILEAVRKYDIDGIQLDDRLVWPGLEMGYDKFTRDLYKKETGKDLPSDYEDASFVQWRMNKITAFSKRLTRAVKAANPNIILSLAPGVYPWARDSYMCDWVSWNKWTDAPQWDENVVQAYTPDFASFKKTWDNQIQHFTDSRADISAGIRLYSGSLGNAAPGDAKLITEYVKKTSGGFSGHSFWYGPAATGQFSSELSSMYSAAGRTSHSKRPSGYRPAPIVGKSTDKIAWNFASVPAGQYRIIAKRGGRWSELKSQKFDGKTVSVKLDSAADQVELLVDRRAKPPASS